MWTAARNTVFMVTHDVDEAILLSDRIALMTNGPDARLAEIVEVKLSRPRSRADVIDDPEYARLRSHIIHFLVERSRHLQEQARAEAVSARAEIGLHTLKGDSPWTAQRRCRRSGRHARPRVSHMKTSARPSDQGPDVPRGGAPRPTSAECRGGQAACPGARHRCGDGLATTAMSLRTDFPLTTDPFKYRLMELVGVYGDALRERSTSCGATAFSRRSTAR